MAKNNCEAPVLIVGESYHNANLFYASGFLAPDAFAYACVDGVAHLLVSSMELGRAEKESRVDHVVSLEEYGYTDRLKQTKSAHVALAETLAAFLDDLAAKSVRVPEQFPLGLAEHLRSMGIEVSVAEMKVEEQRMIKSKDEIEKITLAQRVNERAQARAMDLIKKAPVRDGILYSGNDPLTAERLRREIDLAFVRNGYETDNTIVAAGPRSADPHYIGEGPIPAHQPIIIDTFPYSKKDRYYADMTRTVIKGKPTKEMKQMYRLVLEAQQVALKAIRAGVTGKYVNDRVCDIFEKNGYGTTRTNAKAGFIHSVGHGVGLEIHEKPRLSEAGMMPLEPGMVVTVEPGLYDPAIGGVRLEDLVVVTRKDCYNLTRFPKELVL